MFPCSVFDYDLVACHKNAMNTFILYVPSQYVTCAMHKGIGSLGPTYGNGHSAKHRFIVCVAHRKFTSEHGIREGCHAIRRTVYGYTALEIMRFGRLDADCSHP